MQGQSFQAVILRQMQEKQEKAKRKRQLKSRYRWVCNKRLLIHLGLWNSYWWQLAGQLADVAEGAACCLCRCGGVWLAKLKHCMAMRAVWSVFQSHLNACRDCAPSV